jgi:Ser/Thr protein kinase RdoA (MazF antagonist)
MSVEGPNRYPNAAEANSESVAGVAIALNVGNVPQPPANTRERFAAEELAVALSHFEIGVISEIREFPRGSRKAPKVFIAAETGQYLLKRRARGRDDTQKVHFSHVIQLQLANQQYPLPHLIGTRRGNHSMLQLPTGIYELFEFIPGQNFPQTLDATYEAGRVLALYHKLLEGFQTEHRPSPGSFHAAPAVEQGLRHIPKVIAGQESVTVCAVLGDAYRDAAARVEKLGISTWPNQIVHGDWHPGNTLFKDNRIVAVIDYDSARVLPRIIDAANGALQFSILGGGEDLSKATTTSCS